ncbi:MAG: NADPH-dependent oxidoreductase [Aggregatilineales bacterium]
MTSKTVLDTLNQHVSIRSYTDQDIDNDTLTAILEAARRSPTSSNMQAYSFVVVRDPATKKVLAELAGGQKHIETCPVFVACCADISRLKRACEMHDTDLARNTENMLVSSIDAAIAGMSLATAAESVGLGTVMIGGIRNNPAEAAELLNLPDGAYIVYGMCLGYIEESNRPDQKPRMDSSLIIHHERYDDSDPAAQLTAYDEALSAHYRGEGRNTPDAAWTGVMASRFSSPRRPHLKNILEKLGFSLS